MKTPQLKPSLKELVKNTTRQLIPLIIGASALLLATSQHIPDTQNFFVVVAWSLSIASNMLAIFTLGAMIAKTETSPNLTYTDAVQTFGGGVLVAYAFFGAGLIMYGCYGLGSVMSFWTALFSMMPLTIAILASMRMSYIQICEASHTE